MRKTSPFFVIACLWVCMSLNTYSQSSSLSSRAAYLEKRASLVEADKSKGFEYGVILTDAEKQLDEKLHLMQREMIQTYQAAHFFPPARNFYNSKAHIEQTKLFQLMQKMPKGGILHLHLAAAGDAEWMVEKAVNMPEVYVYWEADNQEFLKGQMACFPSSKVPKGFYAAQSLHQSVPQFTDSLRSFLIFDESIDADSVDIWKDFEAVFKRIFGLVAYRPFFREYLNTTIDSLLADGIQHAEFRIGFAQEGLYDFNQADRYPVDTLIVEFQRATQRARKKDPAFSLKFIQTSLRFFDRDVIWKSLQEAFKNRQRFPDIISGFDLVAEEDAGHETLYFLDSWLKIDSLEQVYGIDMPLFLHDGESNWVSVDNLYDAVLLKSKRIGHGFNLFRFPSLIEAVKKQDICIEISPLSNQILGYIRDLRMHPGSYYLRQGIPVTISSDDPLIFDYSGLSYDFWSIYMAWELDLRGLKQLCKNSLIYSSLTEAEKKQALTAWERKWEAFVKEALEVLE